MEVNKENLTYASLISEAANLCAARVMPGHPAAFLTLKCKALKLITYFGFQALRGSFQTMIEVAAWEPFPSGSLLQD